MLRIVLTLAVLAASVSAAEAASVGALVTSVAGWFAAGGVFAAGTLAGWAARLAIGFSISYLAKAILPKQSPASGGGFKGKIATGGIVPRSFIVGRWPTAGSLVYANTYGASGKTPNQYLVQVIALSDIPVSGLVAVWIDGKQATLNPDAAYDSAKGWTISDYEKGNKDHCWIRFHDGTQTVVDSHLLNQFNDGSSRKWTTAHVGRGVAYLVLTTRYNPKVFTAVPKVLVVLDGAPLYDVRNDTSAGGSGSERYATPSTWTGFSRNAAIIAYNVIRGIRYDGAWFWGGQTTTEASVPYASWAAAANTCDEDVNGTLRYRAGAEISIDERPLDVLERLGMAANAGLAEVAGAYSMVVGGGDGASILSFTDDDTIVSEPQSHDPIKSLSEAATGIVASYISPGDGWQPKSAPPRYDATAESEEGRRLVANVTYDYVSTGNQVQRLMKAAIKEERRERRHVTPLSAVALVAEPLDTLEWTSARNGYSTKDFRVDWIEVSMDVAVTVGLTELNRNDYDWEAADEIAEEDFPPLEVTIPAQAVSGFAVSGVTLTSDNTLARPGILMEWTVDEDLTDIDALEYQVRRNTGNTIVATGQTAAGSFDQGAATGEHNIADGSLASNTGYQVRARYITIGRDRDVDWTAWLPVTTPVVKFKGLEVDDDEIDTNHLVLESVSEAKSDSATSTVDLSAGQDSDLGILINFNDVPVGGHFIIITRANYIVYGTGPAAGNALLDVTVQLDTGSHVIFDSDSTDIVAVTAGFVLRTALIVPITTAGRYRFRARATAGAADVDVGPRILGVTHVKR